VHQVRISLWGSRKRLHTVEPSWHVIERSTLDHLSLFVFYAVMHSLRCIVRSLFCLHTSWMFGRQVQSFLAFLVFSCLLPLIADAAKSCPPGCNCVSNSFDRPDIETTVVDCSYKGFADFPVSLPNSTTELYIQVEMLCKSFKCLSSVEEPSCNS